MENSLLNKIAVWKHEGHPHGLAMEILDQLIKEKKVQKIMKTILGHDTPFSRSKLKNLFSSFERSIISKRKKALPKEDHLPGDLKLKLQEVKMNYSTINSLRSKLLDIFFTKRGTTRKSPNRNLSKKIAFQIEALSAQNRELLFELDYFTEHRKPLEKKPIQQMDNLKRAAYLLNEQVEAVNYIRKQDSHRKRTGNIQNPSLYRERKQIIEEINQFIEKHGK